MIYAGLDVGSRTIKAALYNAADGEFSATGVADQGVKQEALARELLDKALADAELDPRAVAGVVATGYGRHSIGFADRAVTEITCHAKGARRMAPGARTVIDIGGQDSKLVELDARGAVRDFSMNDRCAAGTGCFLEVVARRLGMSLDELGAAAARSANPAPISSTCVVFAETEIVGLLASETPPEDIVAGVQAAICKRVAAMAGGSLEEPVVFTGGVALIPGMAEALQDALGLAVRAAPSPQLAGAIGAALVAAGE